MKTFIVFAFTIAVAHGLSCVTSTTNDKSATPTNTVTCDAGITKCKLMNVWNADKSSTTSQTYACAASSDTADKCTKSGTDNLTHTCIHTSNSNNACNCDDDKWDADAEGENAAAAVNAGIFTAVVAVAAIFA